MTPEQWQGLIQAVGFPICTAIAMGWALYKVGFKLLESHLALVTQAQAGIIQSNADMKEANRTLDNINNELVMSRREQETQTRLLQGGVGNFCRFRRHDDPPEHVQIVAPS